jgi:phage terminase small subunit
MQDYMKAGPDGDPYLDFSGLTREQAAALVEVTVEDFKDGRGEDARDVRRVKFKLADKKAALVDIGKHLGMFKERVELGGPDGEPVRVEMLIVDPRHKG